MDAGLKPEGITALEGIVREGYNGWHDDAAVRMTRSYFEDLVDAGTYDTKLVLAYARQTKSETSIDRIKRIIDKFEPSKRSPDTPPTS